MVWRKLAEPCHNLTFINCSYVKQGAKVQKIDFFKFPSFKLKNIASVVYPHQTRAPYASPTPASFNTYVFSFLTTVPRGDGTSQKVDAQITLKQKKWCAKFQFSLLRAQKVGVQLRTLRIRFRRPCWYLLKYLLRSKRF